MILKTLMCVIVWWTAATLAKTQMKIGEFAFNQRSMYIVNISKFVEDARASGTTALTAYRRRFN